MHPLFQPFVSRRGVVVIDGGLASELERRGVDLGDPLWSARALLDAPEAIEAVHRDYLATGADVITTATYQATLPGLLARGFDEATAAGALCAGVDLAARARDAFRPVAGAPRPLIAASIGSYGAFLATGAEYRGRYGLSEEALAEWHRPRVRIFERSGADLLAFETIPSREEAAAIVRILDEADGPPAWIAFSATTGTRIADGTPVDEAFGIAGSCARVAATGVNCVSPELVSPLLSRGSRGTDKPLVAYPNRGENWDAIKRTWMPRETPVDLGSFLPAWRSAGAVLIGGCCRTTPADIRALIAAL